MRATVYPGAAQGEIVIPPSKSMAHRAIICASLAEGQSVVRNVAYSDDIQTTIAAMRALGARITAQGDGLAIEGVQGVGALQSATVDCRESGSTLRFLIPVFALGNQETRFTGRNRLLQRPQTVYESMFRAQNLPYRQNAEEICLQGPLRAGDYEIAGDISSQFISGLLFALPLLAGDSRIIVRPPYESRSYVELSLQMLARFGIEVRWAGENTLLIPGGQRYRPADYTVEGDYSQFAFFAVLAAIGGNLRCLGLDHDSRQGDRQIVDILKRAHAEVTEIENGYAVRKSPLRACSIDLADCPDLGPVLTVLAAFSQGTTRIYHAARLRYKESDRIAAMQTELRKIGVAIEGGADEIVIRGGGLYRGGCALDGHRDHRIVMSLAVLAAGLPEPIEIIGAHAVEKSYPNFFADWQKVGIKVEECND